MGVNKGITSKINVYAGLHMRTGCKIKHVQVHGSNVMVSNEHGGLNVWYKSVMYLINDLNGKIQTYGFVGDKVLIYINKQLLIIDMEAIHIDDIKYIPDHTKVYEENAAYGRVIFLNGDVYLEKGRENKSWSKLSIDEDGCIRRYLITETEFSTAIIGYNAIKDFMYNNLLSVNNVGKQL